MESLKNLDWLEITQRLAAFATSENARHNLKQLRPKKSPEEAQASFAEIIQTSAIVSRGLRPHMESLDLFAAWHQRLTRNAVLKTLELRDVRHFCLEILALTEVLKEHHEPYLVSLAARLLPAEEPLSAIDQILTPGGDIRSDASERLFQLNNEKSSLGRQVSVVLDRLVKDYQLETLLQDRFVTTREGRWVLPIKSGMQHGFQGIVHAASQSKQTVFMEPQEVVPLNNRLREVEVEIEQEIERLLVELSHYLATLRFPFEESQKALAEADERLAQAQLTVALNARPCEFTNDEIDLQNLRHPLLVLSGSEVIPNSVTLKSDRRLLLLSGPNAGGKTVLMKCVGLAAQMSRCGLPICASSPSRLPFFKELVVALGDSQSVDAHLSTFAAHLKTLNQAAQTQGAQTLLLIDEICGSTDPEEGAALARSFIEVYKKNQVFGVITSHLGALKRGWEKDSGVVNGSLQFDQVQGPTYRFIMGVPGQSLALQTAERVGVHKNILEQALKFMAPEVREYQKALAEAEEMKKQILKIQDSLNQELAATEKSKQKYQEELQAFQKEKEARLAKEIKLATQKVEGLIQESKAQDIFKRHESLQKIKYEIPEIIKAPAARGAHGPTSEAITSAEDFAKCFPPGTSVFIPSLNRDGIVQGRPNAKEEVPVLSSSMRLTLNWRELKPSRTQANPTQKILRKKGHFSFSPMEEDRVVDLRGLTVEDAVSQLEIQLDAASLGNEDRLKVVHGHGTDTLKRAIRSYLSRSVYVKKWTAGTPETGGDGITWVELKD